MKNIFTYEDKMDAVEFANAMGLGNNESEEELSSALSFAYAMGLQVKQPAAKKRPARVRRNILIPQFS